MVIDSIDDQSEDLDEMRDLLVKINNWIKDKEQGIKTGIAAEQMMLPLRHKNNRFKKFALVSCLRGD